MSHKTSENGDNPRWNEDEEKNNKAVKGAIDAKTKVQGVGVLFCVLTMVGTKLGAGIVGLPYAVSKIGYVTAAWMQFAYLIVI